MNRMIKTIAIAQILKSLKSKQKMFPLCYSNIFMIKSSKSCICCQIRYSQQKSSLLTQILQTMDSQTFDKLMQRQKSQQIQSIAPNPQRKSHFDLSTAMQLEGLINSNRPQPDGEAVIMIPVRQDHQRMFHRSVPSIRYISYPKQEDAAEQKFVYFLNILNQTISKQMVNCLLLIQELKKYEVCRFFILKLPQQIQKFFKKDKRTKSSSSKLDLFRIVYKLMREEYNSPSEFYIDMIAMINTAKRTFLFQRRTYINIIQFQQLFWYLKDEVIPKYQYTQSYFEKKKYIRKTPRPKKTTLKKERQMLEKLILEQTAKVRNEVIHFLQQYTEVKQIIKNQKLDLRKVPIGVLREAVFKCNLRPAEDRGSVSPQRKVYFDAEDINNNLKTANFNLDDIYDQSQDQY